MNQTTIESPVTVSDKTLRLLQEEMCRRLDEWQLKEDLSEAAGWLLLCITDPAEWGRTAKGVEPRIRTLVDQWRALELCGNNISSENLEGRHSLQLRQLLRFAYIDLKVIMLALANHLAHLQMSQQLTAKQQEDLWLECADVWLPLWEMLGLWHLRDEWIDVCMERIDPVATRRYRQILQRTSELRKGGFEYVRDDLNKWANHQMRVVCLPRSPRTGSLVYQTKNGGLLDERFSRVVVEVEAENISDCYALLEWAHSLGQPIQDRIQDYIAYPKPNGYRALRTRVMGKMEGALERKLVVELRIFTHEMRLLNEHGIIAARYLKRDAYRNVSCWWDRAKDKPELLAALQHRPIGSPGLGPDQPIYVFTPGGEVVGLDNRSTAIEFAYKVHTDVGHHTRQVYVNGQEAQPSLELTNGDLVRLVLDDSSGPSPAWLHHVRSPKLKDKIRRALAAHKRNLPAGRALIERYLAALEQTNGIVILPPKLEGYLARAAHVYGVESISRLYRNLVAPPPHEHLIPPDRLIAGILEAEFAQAVVGADGQPLLEHPPVPFDRRNRLRFCSSCKPAPGVEIFLEIKKTGSNAPWVLHRLPRANTQSDPKKRVRRPFGLMEGRHCLDQAVKNATIDSSVHWQYVPHDVKESDMWLLGQDRPQLLGDILKVVYENSNVDLTLLNASKDLEGWADILLSLRYEVRTNLQPLENKLAQVSGIARTQVTPKLTPIVPVMQNRAGGTLVNPFSYGNAIEDPEMFFGREPEIRDVVAALTSEQPARVIVLQGPYRSGKTSLALMLQHQLRNPAMRFVYVDLQEIAGAPIAHFYRHVAAKILKSIVLGSDAEINLQGFRRTLADLQEPSGQIFLEFLTALQLSYPQHRWLLVLDEFNSLADNPLAQGLLLQLRAIAMHGYPAFHQFLVVSRESFLHSSTWVRQLYALGKMIPLELLNTEVARRLITEPVRGYIEFDEGVVKQIAWETNGSPYLIHRLCHELIDFIKPRQQRYASQDDLAQVRREFLKNGTTHFDFMNRILDEKGRRLVSAIAIAQMEGSKSFRLEEAAAVVQQSPQKAARLVEYLKENLILESDTADLARLRISIPLFADWLAQGERL